MIGCLGPINFFNVIQINLLSMRSLEILLLLVFIHVAISGVTNTTSFWERTIGEFLHFTTYSGFEQINWYQPRGTSGMHYQLFGAMGTDVTQPNSSVPLTIWLNGGPGSSSLFGAFGENGPIRILQNRTSLLNYPWNIVSHMLYIDQPLDVGFSYSANRTGKQVTNSNQAATHLLNFLYNFYQTWPSLIKSPLYIFGESFGGHYVPPFAKLLFNNQTFASRGIILKGVGLGDGLVDPLNQFNFYDSLLYSVGIVSNKFRDVCTLVQAQGLISIYRKDYGKASEYWDYLTNNDTVWDTYMGGMSEYNWRQYDYGDDTMDGYLQNCKTSLGIPANISYISGNDQVYDSFHQDMSQSYAQDLIFLLKNMRVLIYNGQEDYVINTAGVLNYLNSLQWEGIQKWKNAKKEVWRINGQVRGWVKVSGNLWFVLVNKAGHLVPTDNPKSAYNMFGHYITDDKDWNQ